MSTLRDVAKKAKVSPGTVSRVLSNDQSFQISDETRQNILEAVSELNYIYKSKRKSDTTLRVGVVLALTSEKYGDPFFNTILAAMEKACLESNLSLVTIKNYTELSSGNGLKELLNLKLDGIFLMENLPQSLLKSLKESIPHIVGIDFDTYQFNNVGFDKLEATHQAMEYLLEKGFKKIAYIGGSTPNEAFLSTRRLIGYRESLRRANIEFDDSIVFDCGWDVDTCAKITRDMMIRKNRPDIIFAGSDTLAAVILSVLYSDGYKVPQDISLLGFNNIPGSALTIPALSTIDVPTKTIGTLAVKRMAHLIKHNDDTITNTLVTTSVIERNTIQTGEH